ncbi:MAG: enoyl-CoA hydratase/isomerase family protein [bacterium]|nr:enoyl-CoA hydratase/isomerase family protein [bacterium]
MNYQTIRLERPGEGYAVLTLARPEVRNAVSPQMIEELRDAIDALARDQGMRSVILRGDGATFCSGTDHTIYAERARSGQAFHLSREMQGVLDALWTAPCFAIAALDGDAVGGGLEVALACDYRIARPEARLGADQIELGLMPAWGGRTRLVRTVGRSRALELMLSGRLVAAGEAARYGLVDEIADDALARATQLAVAIAQHPAECVRAIEELVSLEESSSHSADLEREARRFAELWEGPSRRAFAERWRSTLDRRGRL